ncbi:MAG TPA: hypothetical protein GXX77_00695 [Candidatus Cloacimonetes bacterium]|nr:hypothetical protein [Candidatus Cloacimonadota bacterium]
MKKHLLVVLLVLSFLCMYAQLLGDISDGQVTGFELSDMPNDDGSGIILKWKPLPREYRVIKYNIYRGVSPDSLFLLTDLESDPKQGVMAPYLYYYDSGDQPLIEFETAPAKPVKERKQPEDSPLFRSFPRDAETLNSVMDRYFIAGITKASNLYKRSTRVKQDETTFNALKLTQFDGVYAIPVEGVTYYYAVAAVNEKGFIYPHSEVLGLEPIDNAPDASATVNVTYVRGKPGRINFEWIPSLAASDIALWEGWMIPRRIVGDDGILPQDWQDNALPIFQLPNMARGANRYHSEEFDASFLDPQEFVPVLSYMDYAQQSAAVVATHYRHLDASQLPIMPNYKVVDKPNDKGDCMLVSFGKPLAYITQAEYTSKQHRRIRLNYEISESEGYTVDKVRFVFKTVAGEEIGTATENYTDKIIYYNLPKDYHDSKHLKVEITVKYLGKKEYENDAVYQDIIYDDYFLRFQPQSSFFKGQNIEKTYFDVLVRSRTDWDFSSEMRSPALIRAYDHTIPYEDIVFRPISGYDPQSGRFLFELRFPIETDPENMISFDLPYTKAEFLAEMQEREELIASLKSIPEGEITGEELMHLQMAETEYDFITNHPAYKDVIEAKSEKEWLKRVLKHKSFAERSYQYKVVSSDGKGGFTISEIYEDQQNNSWLFPISQWFDTTKTITFFATLLLMILVVYAIYITRVKEVYIRPIAGLQEIDNAIGRATEMGRPVMFVPGWGTLGDVCTIASLMVLAQVAKKTAEYDVRLINPHCDYMVLPLAQEMVSSSYSEVGRPDSYNQNDIFFVSDDQFPFTAGVNGITLRERVATIFYMGFFNAEALLLTETGNQTGAIQIAATDAVTQVPFFITTCDYTLIGEEFYAASAYLSKNHDMVSMLKAQDYFKLFIIITIILGAVLSTFNITSFIHSFPLE